MGKAIREKRMAFFMCYYLPRSLKGTKGHKEIIKAKQRSTKNGQLTHSIFTSISLNNFAATMAVTF